jgi:hypothetical protein
LLLAIDLLLVRRSHNICHVGSEEVVSQL